MAELDNILSGKGEAAPAPETDNQETQHQEPAQQQDSGATEPSDDVTESPDGRKMVPLEALAEARGKAKRYTEQVAEFEKSMTGLRTQNETLTRQVTELLQRLPQQEKPQAPVPDFFENPAEATRHAVTSTVAPQFEQLNSVLMANAQLVAEMKYGDDKVAAAEQAFIEALSSKKLDPADIQKVVNAPNRYAAAVQWHERHKALAEMGPDPAAYKTKLEAEVEARVLEKYGIKPGAPPAQSAAVMPSNLAGARNVGNRAGPTWSGPQTLNDIFAR